ncbi:ABC transporter substrate-binding protein [Streptomyces hoynatensis]|uniref:ABC transporter substrate-binding protein n=1 Tax=Streptomyces hoynatensis TaxID=1141874 RepID=A0A3A9Z5Z3_9ACTN|nr:ABC transporter substrate-binding protein [Streptomyces hoynatensis]RKN43713.1 ABC transporter substrate-binding protein [Streptomyces hoynatensis]
MTTSRLPRLSRRALLSAGGALGAGALLAACGSDDSSGSSGGSGSGSGSGGGFSFTDDRGEKVELDAIPERIVAFVGTAAALHDYGVECVGVFGPTKQANGEPDVQAGDLDVDSLTSLGSAWGEFNVEAYAQLNPQLLISNMFEADTLWYVPEESADDILGLAKSIGIQVAPTVDPDVTLDSIIARYTELAGALGADLSAGPVTQAKTQYEQAAEALRQAARDNAGIKVLACSADADLFYVSNPAASADLAAFKQLGVDLIVPENLDEGGFYESLSWENAGRYPADVLLLDSRSSALQPADLSGKPTWAQLPAVVADQVTPWNSEPRYSHAGCAPVLQQLADALSAARKVS